MQRHWLLAVIVFFHAALGFAHVREGTIEGIYEGSVKYFEPDNLEIPLKVALTLKRNPAGTTGDLYEIVGSFVIDNEGGPYPFNKIFFEFDTSKIDLVYRRPQTTRARNVPADVRFTGTFLSYDEFEGKVLLGRKGPIGTFKLVKNPNAVFASKQKYHGYWSGVAKTATRANWEFSINIAATGNTTLNPEDMDLEFTAGKIGYITFSGIKMDLESVYIDYFNRSMIFIHHDRQSGAILTFAGSIDDQSGVMRGTIDSSFQGRTGSFAVRMR